MYVYNDCKCYVPLKNTVIRYEFVSGQQPEPHGVDFVMNGDKYRYICADGYSSDGDELNTYLNQKNLADDTIQAFQRLQSLILQYKGE